MERYYEAYGKKGVGGTPEQILEKIVYRYLQENPEREYTFRAFHVWREMESFGCPLRDTIRYGFMWTEKRWQLPIARMRF